MLTNKLYLYIINIESRIDMDITKIIKKINAKNRVPRFIFMVIGVFLLALNYNLFLTRYELVVGGTGGLAIIFNKLFGWNHQIFIYITSFILVLISIYALGFNKTKKTIIGSILYPLMVTFTLPLSNLLAEYFVFDDFITLVACTSILYGFSNALIFKMGYTTGGSDVIMQIMTKYLHMLDGRASFICSLVVILLGGIFLGVNKVIYAIIIVYIANVIIDKMLIGISKSKLFFINTTKLDEVSKSIIENLHLGVTIIEAKGGYSNNSQPLIMCAVPTKDYYMFKEFILAIDKNAFFIINDCYDIEGGTTKMKEYGLDSII